MRGSRAAVAALAVIAIIIAVVLVLRGRDSTKPAKGAAPTATATAGAAGGEGAAAGARRGVRSELVVRVRDTAGAAVAGAVVVVRAPHREAVFERTDASGNVTFASLVADTWTVTASAPKRLPASTTVTLVDARDDVELRLDAGGALLRGKVTDGRTGPIAGARVDAARTTRGGSVAQRAVASTLTDEQGGYELTVAAAGYDVTVSHEAYAPGGRRVDVAATGAVADFELLPGGAIEGRVVGIGSASGGQEQPVAGALVYAVTGSGSERIARVAADGTFRVTGLPPARIFLDASAPGWLTVDSVEVPLVVGEEIRDIVLQLRKAARVSGTVVTADGAPVSGADVVLLTGDASAYEQTTAAADGTFEIEAVEPGAYQVISAPDGWVNGATPIEVRDTDVTGVRVVRSAAPVIRGRVEPAQQAEVWLQPVAGGPPILQHAPTRTAADGTFELTPADVGKMRVAARTARGEQGASDITVTAAGLDVVVTLRPGAVIAGRVVDDKGGAVPGVAVMALPLGSSRLTTIARGGISDGLQVPVGTDGAFRVDGLLPGHYELRVLDDGRPLTKPDGAPAATLVSLTDGQQRDVTLVVRPASGVVRGVVQRGDGSPVADAWVRAVQTPWELFNEIKAGAQQAPDAGGASADAISIDDQAGSIDVASPVLTGADGRFELRGLRHGEIEIIAEAERGALRGRAQAKPDADITIVVAAPGGIAGTVTLAGAPVTAFEVSVRGPSSLTRKVADAGGRFALARLEAGRYAVNVSTERGSVTKEGVVVGAGANATVELALEAYGTITGKLVDESGQPVAGVPINPNLVLPNGNTTFGLRGPVPITGADGRFSAIVAPGKLFVFAQLHDKLMTPTEVTVAPGATVDVGSIVVRAAK